MNPWLIAGIIVFIILAGLTILHTYHVHIKRVKVTVKGIDRPQRIAFVSDMHFRSGSQTVQRLFARAVKIIDKLDVDLVVLGGDYIVNWDAASLDLVRDALEPITVLGAPKVAIMGNHDYYRGDPSALAPIFADLGIKLLRNDVERIGDMTIAGLDSSHQERERPDAMSAVLCTMEHPRIVLWHEPDAVDLLDFGCADLMIAGHTHGGQFISPWGWGEFSATMGKKYNRGMFTDTPVPLYVSCGLGTCGIYLRLFAPSELTIVTLIPDDSEDNG